MPIRSGAVTPSNHLRPLNKLLINKDAAVLVYKSQSLVLVYKTQSVVLVYKSKSVVLVYKAQPAVLVYKSQSVAGAALSPCSHFYWTFFLLTFRVVCHYYAPGNGA